MKPIVLQKPVLLLSALLCVSCVERPAWKIVSAEGVRPSFEWTEEERQKKVAVRTVDMSDEASCHLVRLRASERMHSHDSHDHIVFILSGSSRIHIADKVYDLNPGDVIIVKRGVAHWAENSGPEAAEAFVVFTPPFDGRDVRLYYDH